MSMRHGRLPGESREDLMERENQAFMALKRQAQLESLLVRGRKRLASETQIPDAQLLEWVNLANYLQIKGMGAAKPLLARRRGRSGAARHRGHESEARGPGETAERRDCWRRGG